MEVAKLSGLPNFEVRFVSCNESVIKRWLSSELERIVFSLTHELFMTKHHTVTLIKSDLLKSFTPTGSIRRVEYNYRISSIRT